MHAIAFLTLFCLVFSGVHVCQACWLVWFIFYFIFYNSSLGLVDLGLGLQRGTGGDTIGQFSEACLHE